VRLPLVRNVLILLSMIHFFCGNVFAEYKRKAVFSNNQGVRYNNHGLIEDAIVAYKKAIEEDEKYPDPCYNLGVLYYEQKEYNLAVLYLQQAVMLGPEVPEPYFDLGMVFFKLDLLDKAKEQFVLAMTKKPKFYGSYYGLGILEYKKGNYKEASELYKKSLMRKPEDVKILYAAALCFNKLGDVEEARRLLENSISLNPDFAESYFYLAQYYFDHKDWDKALALYQEAKDRKEKEWPEVILYRGICFFKKKERELAQPLLKQALQNSETKGLAYYYLAALDVLENDKEKLFAQLNKAVELDPKLALMAYEDPDLDSLKADPRFLNIVKITPTPLIVFTSTSTPTPVVLTTQVDRFTPSSKATITTTWTPVLSSTFVISKSTVSQQTRRTPNIKVLSTPVPPTPVVTETLLATPSVTPTVTPGFLNRVLGVK